MKLCSSLSCTMAALTSQEDRQAALASTASSCAWATKDDNSSIALGVMQYVVRGSGWKGVRGHLGCVPVACLEAVAKSTQSRLRTFVATNSHSMAVCGSRSASQPFACAASRKISIMFTTLLMPNAATASHSPTCCIQEANCPEQAYKLCTPQGLCWNVQGCLSLQISYVKVRVHTVQLAAVTSCDMVKGC